MRFFLITILVLETLFVKSQPVKMFFASPAPDFTMISMDGDTFNLYTELDKGKIVILDFFATGCPSCQQNTPKLDSIWQAYGYNGDSLWVWGIECSFGDSNYVQNIDDFEATFGGQFPIFSTFQNTDSVLTAYDITWTPQYYLICPNNKIKLPRMEITEIDSVIQTCRQILASGDNPIRYSETISPSIFFANNKIHISRLSGNKMTLTLYTLTGNMVFRYENKFTNSVTITLPNNLPLGIYLINIRDGENIFRSKHFFAK